MKGTWTSERSYLACLRASLPSGRARCGSDAQQSASLPGQNGGEVVLVTALCVLFQVSWCVEMIGSWWWGVPLGLVMVHLSGVLAAVIGSFCQRCRPLEQAQAVIWPQRWLWAFLLGMAWFAVKHPLALTQYLAWPVIAIVVSQLFLCSAGAAWIDFCFYVGAQIVAIALCLLLPSDWRWGLPVVFLMHTVMCWHAFHPRARLFARAQRRFETDERCVWLTIDDGPSAHTEAMLALLKQYEAKATFFLIGERAEKHPEVVTAIHEEGHEIGNHTYRHPASSIWAYPGPWWRREIKGAQEVFRKITGRVPERFRSPVGFKNPMLQAVLDDTSLAFTGWSARGYDGVSSDVEKIVERLFRKVEPGAILLLHEGESHHIEVLRLVLARLKDEGFRCVIPESG